MNDAYCSHPAYCRDEAAWRKAIMEAENSAYDKAISTFQDEYSKNENSLVGVIRGLKAISRLKQPI